MGEVNYMRALRRVKCNACNHECYDIDTEDTSILYSPYNYIFDKESGCMVCKVNYMFCPKCGEGDNFEYLDNVMDCN